MRLLRLLLLVAIGIFPSTSSSGIKAGLADSLLQPIQQEQCNFFKGEWIPDPSEPPYTNNSCNFIEPRQDCLMNGRPDMDYLHWRWKPRGCDFRPSLLENFLNSMRDKNLGFIGDSLTRNQVQSLICLLSQIEQPVYEELPFVSSNKWYFPTYNFTVSLIWSLMLLKIVGAVGKDDVIEVHLDILDSNWTSQYGEMDYVQIASGEWFFKRALLFEDGKIVGCSTGYRINLTCQSPSMTNLGCLYSYGRALHLAFRFVIESSHRPQLVVHRSLTPHHFYNGTWDNGGRCNRTWPYREGEYTGDPVDRAMKLVGEGEFADAAAAARVNGIHMRFLDVYSLSELRPDGHPDVYIPSTKKGTHDCLHWCMPGPVDTWNYLLMELLLGDHEGYDDN